MTPNTHSRHYFLFVFSYFSDGARGEGLELRLLETKFDRPDELYACGLRDKASHVFPVNHSMLSSNYNIAFSSESQ